MTESMPIVDKTIHRTLAVELFNLTWDLMDNLNRSTEEDHLMISAAHASRYHWGVVGTPINFARGEWQISRVYAILNDAEASLRHGFNSLKLCLDHDLDDMDLAFAYEAVSRGYALTGDVEERNKYIALAKHTAVKIEKKYDRDWLLHNIETIYIA